MSIRKGLARGLLVLFVLSLSWPVDAAVLVVDSEADAIDIAPGDGLCDAGPAVPGGSCTLRAAIMEAEANFQADTIRLPAGANIILTLSGEGGTEAGDLDVTTDIEILGFEGSEPPVNPALLPTINAEALNDRHFDVTNAQLSLRGLRLIRGTASGSRGGAIRTSNFGRAQIMIEHVVFRENFASVIGGAISVGGFSSLEVSDSQFLFNNAGQGGATGGAAAIIVNGFEAAPGRTVIRRSSFLDNRSTNSGSTITVQGFGQLELENSTLDGTPFSPPEPGNSARTGIMAQGESTLILRNLTITNFAESALDLRDLDGNEDILISNSILEPDADDPLLEGCTVSGTDLEAANVSIGYSIVQDSPACSDYFSFGVSAEAAGISPLTDDAPPRLTVSRRPTGPLSNVVDAGADIDFIPGGVQFACTTEDQIGTGRILDANLDESLRCDIGAIEQLPPDPFVVNHFADDLTDDLPGDGECATADTVGIGVVCTLRAAIMEANAAPGLAHITFAPSDDPVVLSLPDSGAVGGALEITDTVAIDGNLVDGLPATGIGGQMAGERLFLVDAPNLLVHFRNLRMSGGEATGGLGGAIAVLLDSDVRIGRSEFVANSAASGGGVAALGGSLRIRNSDFDANQAESNGLALFGNFGARIEVNDSSFRNHLGVEPGGGPNPTIDLDPNVDFTITNSTFSGNQFGIRADNPSRLSMWHLTLYDQLNGGFGIALNASSRFTLYNSIVAAPASALPDCLISGDDIASSFQFAGMLDSDGSCASLASNAITAAPGLLPLTRSPGQISFHHAPRVEAGKPSPALDVGMLFLCQLDRDQYGQRRPVDLDFVPDLLGPCDLGAIEAQAPDALFADAFEEMF